MAKPPGAKTLVIREAIRAYPDKGNMEVAELINNADARKDDRISVTAVDVNNQKQALKNLKAPANGEPAAALPRPNSRLRASPKRRRRSEAVASQDPSLARRRLPARHPRLRRNPLATAARWKS